MSARGAMQWRVNEIGTGDERPPAGHTAATLGLGRGCDPRQPASRNGGYLGGLSCSVPNAPPLPHDQGCSTLCGGEG
jgi:hypothetical protein